MKDIRANFMIDGRAGRRFKRQITQNGDKTPSNTIRKLIELYSILTKKQLNLDDIISMSKKK